MITLEVEGGGERGMRSTLESQGLKTYSQLLALAERSAQQSIRTQRKIYSSVISRGTFWGSVRVENNPELDPGSSAEAHKQQTGPKKLIHRPASSGSSTGEARSFAPGSPVPPNADPAQKGRGEGENRDARSKTLWPSGLTRTFSSNSTSFSFFGGALTQSARRRAEIKSK